MDIIHLKDSYEEDWAMNSLAEDNSRDNVHKVLHDYASEAVKEQFVRVIKRVIFANEKCKKLLLDGAKVVQSSFEFEDFIDDVCFYVGLDNPIFYEGSDIEKYGITYDDGVFSVALDIRQELYGID